MRRSIKQVCPNSGPPHQEPTAIHSPNVRAHTGSNFVSKSRYQTPTGRSRPYYVSPWRRDCTFSEFNSSNYLSSPLNCKTWRALYYKCRPLIALPVDVLTMTCSADSGSSATLIMSSIVRKLIESGATMHP